MPPLLHLTYCRPRRPKSSWSPTEPATPTKLWPERCFSSCRRPASCPLGLTPHFAELFNIGLIVPTTIPLLIADCHLGAGNNFALHILEIIFMPTPVSTTTTYYSYYYYYIIHVSCFTTVSFFLVATEQGLLQQNKTTYSLSLVNHYNLCIRHSNYIQ